jgi:ATP-dependent DNA helicase DinG
MTTLADFFREGGYLSEQFPHYHPRLGQVELAVAVEDAIEFKHHLLGEGPCGVGKGQAYLLPAVMSVLGDPERRVAICTETIALQEQLVQKDIPLLAKAIPEHFSWALLKGRVNYLCQRKYNTPRPSAVSGSPSRIEELINQWAATTEAGDRSELKFKPDGETWSYYGSTSEECLGKKCRWHDECWANKARNHAKESDLVVTNYHMLMANIQFAGAVLPPFQILICDEAHRIPDVARDCLGLRVSYHSVRRLLKWAKDYTDEENFIRNLEDAADRLFDKIGEFAESRSYTNVLKAPGFVDYTTVVKHLNYLQGLAEEAGKNPLISETEQALAEKAGAAAKSVSERIVMCIDQADDRNVYWIETHRRYHGTDWYSLEARPIEVAGILNKQLFGAVETAILVSATMTTAGNFKFLRGEVGAPPESAELMVASPFDWMTQARYLVPGGIPEPPSGKNGRDYENDEAEWQQAVAERLIEVVYAARGRTLGLFTSRRAMNYAAEQLRHSGVPGPVLVQEPDLTVSKLVEEFRQDERSVLLGVSSLWTGVDVPGNSCQVVFIDRIPFPNPRDPLVAAIQDRISKAVGDQWAGWRCYSIPQAIMKFRQGVGRLLRDTDDRGVVVVADQRLRTKGYASQFFTSLPPMQGLRSIDEIEEFLWDGLEEAPPRLPPPAPVSTFNLSDDDIPF